MHEVRRSTFLLAVPFAISLLLGVGGCKRKVQTTEPAIAAVATVADALACPKCAGRMRVLRLVRETHDIRKSLTAMGEASEPPARAPARGPPFWASRVLRIRANADAA